MSFSKGSNLEAKKVIHFKLCHQSVKGTIISDKQNLENRALSMGFMHLKIEIKEKFRLKTKLTEEKFKNQFYISYVESFQLLKAV